MRFTRLSERAYANFIERRDRVFFTQLPEFVEAQRETGQQVDLVGVVGGEPEHLLMAAAVSYQPWKRFFRRAMVIYGPTIKDYSPDIERTFYEGLKNLLAADGRVLSARITPRIERRTYSDIEPGPELERAGEFERLIESLGGHRVMLDYYDRPDIQIRYAYVKDIESMSFADVTKSVSQHVRTAFNRKGTNGVEVRFVSPDDVDILAGVLESTAERTGMHEVSTHSLEMYQRVARKLGPEHAFFPVATLHTAKYLEQIAAERAEIEAKAEQLRERRSALEAEGKNLGKKQRNQLREHESRLEVLDRREAETREVQAAHGDEVVLAASFFLHSPGELTYLSSGAYAEFNSYYGIYLIHREMFEWATANDVKVYNFFGVSGDFTDDASDAGVLHFKRQFVGDVEEYVGTYDLPIRPRLAKALGALD